MENAHTERLTNWLRQQDPTEEYVWSDPVHCMMGKYLDDNGSPGASAVFRHAALRGDRRREAVDVWCGA